ncbi:NAD(P)-dependent oxidoreductase [Halorubrum ejinorense]|uniref:NAD(P)-dependent oxidoreductase n=2 Tax=Halorubrum ejinorense TaxID=425309 RepID=A0ABV4ITV4_9EURY
MTVLITGGAGFVGANVVRHMAEGGRETVCFDRDAGDSDRLREWYFEDARERIDEVEGDVSDPEDLREAVERYDVDRIVHAATITPTPEAERDQARTILDVNLLGTANVLDAARDAGVDRVVYISSGAVYRNNSELEAIDEYDSLDLDGLYPISKHGSEQLCRLYEDRYGLETVTARLGWVYGHMERPTGSRQHMSSVYNAMRAAIEGENIRINDPDRLRDWTHSRDVARGLQTLLAADSLGEPVYNLTAGEGYPMRQVVDRIADLFEGIKTRRVDSRLEANVPVSSSSRRGHLRTTRLSRETGFTPKLSLEEGLAEYRDWFRRAQSAGVL